MQTAIGAFDDHGAAQRAVDRLVQSGFERQDIHVQQGTLSHGTASQRHEDPEDRGWFSNFIHSLFGTEDQANTGHAHTYDEAVRRGSSVVVVDAQDERQADLAVALLHEMGAIDVDERAKQWRAEGWMGGAPQPGSRQSATASGQQASLTTRIGPTDKLPEGKKEGVLDVAQEELNVGKRSRDRAGVRVVQRVAQKPVREMVRLREEHALRRKDVDVQRVQGDQRPMTERERAMAADRSTTPLAGRDPDAADGSASDRTLRKPRKDKPAP